MQAQEVSFHLFAEHTEISEFRPESLTGRFKLRAVTLRMDQLIWSHHVIRFYPGDSSSADNIQGKGQRFIIFLLFPGISKDAWRLLIQSEGH